jgi:hypothetical protein
MKFTVFKKNDLPQWLKIIHPICPFLATVMQSQYSHVAIQLCLKQFQIPLISVTDDYQSCVDFVLSANVAQLKQLPQVESTLRKELKVLRIDASDLYVLQKTGTVNVFSSMILTIITTLGFFLVLGFMLFYDIPQTGRDALLIMLGALSSGWNSILSYYFGSSSGQDQMITHTGSANVDSPD